MTQPISRNAPCPCGSGKKYKHCCLRREQAAPATARPPGSSSLVADLDALRLPSGQEAGPPPSSTELLAREAEASAWAASRGRIAAASLELEAQRSAFEALLADEKALAERAHRLFAEPAFARFRFSRGEVERALAAVGYLNLRAGAENRRAIRLAIGHLADADQRWHTARRLMLRLPGYVEEGRHLDAWLIQHSARLLLEAPKEDNPFLEEMFRYGLA